MLRHVEWHEKPRTPLRLGEGVVEGRGLRCVEHDGIVGQDQVLDFIHTIGALFVNRDIPGNQICLVAVCRNAQGVDQALARLRVIHRAIRDAAANAVLNSAVQLLPVRSVGDGVKDALVEAELFGKKGASYPSRRLWLDSQGFKFMVEHGALGRTQTQR